MQLKHNMLAMALFAAGIGLTANAMAATGAAQDQPQATGDQAAPKDGAKKDDKARPEAKKLSAVEVNGFISSIENSTALKRNASTIVEAVSAEQVGKLPGVSIADTLGRLPGLAVQTVSGRPQVLTIHGLGPDFSTALINGGQQVSTSNNRDVQFDQYPSSWFDNVVVHLSPEANLIGQGLAGTVDMHTIRPLEKNGPEAAVNAHYIWNSLGELAPGPGVSDKGYNVNGVWVNQFANRTIGVTLGVDLENNPTQIEHQAPWGYPTDANGNYVIGGSKNYGITDSMKRRGLLATVQWQPNESYTGTVDMTYDNFKEVQQLKGMEFPLFWSGAQLQPGSVVQNGMDMSGSYAKVKPVIRNDYNSTSARVYNFNFDNKFTVNENWTIDADANYSRATRRDVNLESYSGTGFGGSNGALDTVNFSELPGGLLWLTPSLDYTNGVVLTDPQGWGGGNDVVQAGFINAPRTVDALANLRLSVERSFSSGPVASVDFGVNGGRRTKSYHIDQTFLTLGGGTISGGSAVTTAPITGASTCDPLAFMGIGAQLCYDPFSLMNNGTLVGVPTFGSNTGLPPNWNVREKTLTPFVQANIDTFLGGISLRGNVGVQAQHISQHAEGERVAPGSVITGSGITLIPVVGETSYTKVLPSANLIFGLTDNDDVRLSAARTQARPRMDQMNASLAISTNVTHLPNTDPNQAYFSASGGNAKLKPTMADNYNVSYEHYFSGGSDYQCNANDAKNSDLCHIGAGYFSVSGYFLKLQDYINPNAAYLYDFSSFLPFNLTPAQQAMLGTTQGIVSGPTNDGHGYVKGLQGTLNLPFDLIAKPLRGFGVLLTANRTKSSLVYGGNPSPITVPGLSKWVANATLYYQHNGFEARVSDSYRSDFLGEVSGISATRVEQTLKGGSSYDAQVSYSFTSGALKGLTFIAQGSNLSNKIFTTFQNNDPRQVQTWEQYGRRYDIGVSYKFQ